MKTTRRRFLQTIGAGVTGAGFAGQTLAAVPGPVPIQFWDMKWGPPDIYANAARNMVNRYNAMNIDVNVGYQAIEWSSWPEIFFLAAESGQAPDISTGGAYQAVQMYEKGQILEIDDVIADLKQTGEDKDFLPGTLERFFFKGHTVALPFALDIRVIYYRKDLFAKAGVKVPTTWDELRAAAKTLTSAGQYGLVLSAGEVAGMQALFMLMINNGGGVFAPDGTLDFMNPRNVEAMTFVSNLVKDGSVNPRSSTLVLDDSRAEFMGTGGAIIISGMGLQTQFADQKDKIGLLPPPIGPHGERGTLSAVNPIMLYSQGHSPKATKAFLKWWSANQKALWTEGQCLLLPARASIAADPYFQNDPITRRITSEWAPIGRSPGWRSPNIFPALNELEGYGPLTMLAQDLLQGKDVLTSMREANMSLKRIVT